MSEAFWHFLFQTCKNIFKKHLCACKRQTIVIAVRRKSASSHAGKNGRLSEIHCTHMHLSLRESNTGSQVNESRVIPLSQRRHVDNCCSLSIHPEQFNVSSLGAPGLDRKDKSLQRPKAVVVQWLRTRQYILMTTPPIQTFTQQCTGQKSRHVKQIKMTHNVNIFIHRIHIYCIWKIQMLTRAGIFIFQAGGETF